MGVPVSQCQGWLGICVGAEALCLVRAWQYSLAQRCTTCLVTCRHATQEVLHQVLELCLGERLVYHLQDLGQICATVLQYKVHTAALQPGAATAFK